MTEVQVNKFNMLNKIQLQPYKIIQITKHRLSNNPIINKNSHSNRHQLTNRSQLINKSQLNINKSQFNINNKSLIHLNNNPFINKMKKCFFLNIEDVFINKEKLNAQYSMFNAQ